MIGMISF